MSSEVLQSDNSAGSLRPLILRLCIPKESVTTAGDEEDGGCSLIRNMKSSLARPLGTPLPSLAPPLLGLGWWLGVLPDSTPATRSEFKVLIQVCP